MKTFVKNLYNHLCTWAIIYVIGVYCGFSVLNLKHEWFKDPYNIAMCVIGAFFLFVILVLEMFVRHWEIKDSQRKK